MREHEIIIRFKLPRSSRTRWVLSSIAGLLIIGSVAYAAAPNTFSPGDPLSSSKLNANFSALDGRIAALEVAVTIPPGTIASYAGSVVPSGWLLCDGTEINRTQYAALFAAISIAHGGGNGVSTFNLPDYRGRFLRGTDNGAGRDPDRTTRSAANSGGNSGDNVGSIQGDDFKAHNHNILTHDGSGAISGEIPLGWFPGSGGSASNYAGMSMATGGGPGSESRPKNASVNFIIKT
jgi:microcystin-dependent protein